MTLCPFASHSGYRVKGSCYLTGTKMLEGFHSDSEELGALGGSDIVGHVNWIMGSGPVTLSSQS